MGALDFPQLRSFIAREIERNEDYLSSSWYPLVCQIFRTGPFPGASASPEKINCFYNSVNTLVSNQVRTFPPPTVSSLISALREQLRDLLERSIATWCSIFNPADQDYLPIIKVDIVLNEGKTDAGKIDFDPTIPEFIAVLQYVVEKIGGAINRPERVRIATMQSSLSGDDNVPLSTEVTKTVVERACQELAEVTKYYFQEPTKLLKSYEEKYNYLINGVARAEVEKFITENHTFDDYSRVSRGASNSWF